MEIKLAMLIGIFIGLFLGSYGQKMFDNSACIDVCMAMEKIK